MIHYIITKPDGAITFYDNLTRFSKCSALSVVKQLCKEMLFSYESRLKLTKSTFNINYKVPIYINEDCLLIPTASTRTDDCIWINAFAIQSIDHFKHETTLYFSYGSKIVINVTKSIIERQLKTAFIIEDYLKKQL